MMNSSEALTRAYAIIDKVRATAFKDNGASFTDAQIWQAVLDEGSAEPYGVSARLLSHVIDGRPVPSADHIPDREVPDADDAG